MQSRTEHGGWVATEGVPPLLWIMWGGGAAISVVGLGVAFGLDLLQPALGLAGSVVVVALFAASEVGINLLFANLLRPRAIRPEPAGIEVRPMFGPVRALPWSATHIVGASGGSTFSILRYAQEGSTTEGSLFLSAAQAIAIRSSPFRPESWSAPNPGGS